MNGNSKREKVDRMIRRAVREAIHEAAFFCPGYAEVLRNIGTRLEIEAAGSISNDPYRMQELDDIMRWRNQGRGKEATR